jgi:hypothetical protein
LRANQRKPPLTTTRYKQMVRELGNLYNKYQGDLDVAVPMLGMSIAHAMSIASRFKSKPRAGAPGVWTPGQLARLWVVVEARRNRNPQLTVSDVCAELARHESWYPRPADDPVEDDKRVRIKGYEVWAEESRSLNREEVTRFISNPQQLRRRYAEAERQLRKHPRAREALEKEARRLPNISDKNKGPLRRRTSG